MHSVKQFSPFRNMMKRDIPYKMCFIFGGEQLYIFSQSCAVRGTLAWFLVCNFIEVGFGDRVKEGKSLPQMNW